MKKLLKGTALVLLIVYLAQATGIDEKAADVLVQIKESGVIDDFKNIVQEYIPDEIVFLDPEMMEE